MLTDTHVHLNYPGMEGDLPGVIERAFENGVTRMIAIGTSLEGSAEGVATARANGCIRAAVGIHPTDESLDAAAANIEETRRELLALAAAPEVVAIGETGLDFFRLPQDPIKSAPQKECQERLFRLQLDSAVKLNLPVVIHQRASWDETLAVLKEYEGRLRAVFHCFGGSKEQAGQLLDMGHLVSFTGIVTFKNGADVLAVAAALPEGSFMVETDAPYLAPVPFRGQTCEPMHVRWTAETIANARGESLEELARHTNQTVADFFGWQPDEPTRG